MTRREKRMPAYKAFIEMYDFGLEDLPGEIWKPIPDFDGYYCSSLARVMSLKEHKPRIMRPTLNTDGRLIVNLCKNGKHQPFLVSRLVATVFIPNPDNLPQVDHVYGNIFDNSVENLRWVTNEQNMQYAKELGLMRSPSGEDNYQAGVTNEQARWIREHFKPRDAQFGTVALGKMFGLSNQVIGGIVHGETYKDAGGKIHEKNQPKIPHEERAEIRRLYATGEYSYAKLGEMFGVNAQTAWNIVHEK